MQNQTDISIFSDPSVFTVARPTFAAARFTATFHATVNAEPTTFHEIVDFTALAPDREPDPILAELLALALSLSYYKATDAATIRVEFPLTPAARTFYAELIANGLGECAYRNNAPGMLAPTIAHPHPDDPSTTGTAPAPAGTAPASRWRSDAPPLVAVGGGKDSIVAIEALKRAGHQPVLFSVRGFPPIDATVAVARCRYLMIARHLDPALIRANEAGAPNGHVPVTAMHSLIGLIAADLAGLGPVVFANEASANFGNLTWGDLTINHQWSKSLAFETLLSDTLAAHGLESTRYFSLLRGLDELDIARAFARLPEYFAAFSSCNRAYLGDPSRRADRWCGRCAKCVFIFCVLAPWVPRTDLLEIFGEDVLDQTENATILREVLGLSAQKPFDCVGEPWEASAALNLIAQRSEWRRSRLVAACATATASTSLPEPTVHPDRVPDEFAAARAAARELAR